ncbi:hypothetical protein CDD83_9987 [Cordyceps sp. RAO-2017]|nr:hypothetical protein CDD83_9987 [Cordyceps sp. RAO-2017]
MDEAPARASLPMPFSLPFPPRGRPSLSAPGTAFFFPPRGRVGGSSDAAARPAQPRPMLVPGIRRALAPRLPSSPRNPGGFSTLFAGSVRRGQPFLPQGCSRVSWRTGLASDQEHTGCSHDEAAVAWPTLLDELVSSGGQPCACRKHLLQAVPAVGCGA